MRFKKILEEAVSKKHAFKGTPKTPLKEDKPKAAPSDEKLKSMGNKDAAEMTGSELTGIVRSLKKETEMKLTKKDVDPKKVTDGYGNDVDLDTSFTHATDLRAEDEVEKKDSNSLKEAMRRFRILREAGEEEKEPEKKEPEPTDSGEFSAPKTPAPKANAPTGNEPADQAHKLGLQAGGWGTWKDKGGETVAKTVKGHLVKLSDKEKADQAQGAEKGTTDSGEFGGAPATKPQIEKPAAEPSSKLSDLMPNLDEPRIKDRSAIATRGMETAKKVMAATGKGAAESYTALNKAITSAKSNDEIRRAHALRSRFEAGIDELSRRASADLYDTMHEAQSRDSSIVQSPAWKPIKGISDLGGRIEEEGSESYSAFTKALAYDFANGLNQQLASNPHAIDPDEVEANFEELRDAVDADDSDRQPPSEDDIATSKADADYDEWNDEGRPSVWRGRRMR